MILLIIVILVLLALILLQNYYHSEVHSDLLKSHREYKQLHKEFSEYREAAESEYNTLKRELDNIVKKLE